MKTNKQRATIILKKYQESQKIQNNQIVNKDIFKQKNKFNFKVFACVMVVVVLIAGVTLGWAFGVISQNGYADKMYIVNFDKYVAIGGGSQIIDNTNQSNTFVQKLDSSDNEKNYLLGVDRYGNIEKLSFALNNSSNNEEQNSDTKIEQNNWQLNKILAFNKFTVVEFGQDVTSLKQIENNYFYCKYSYIIDNDTGEMYSLNLKELNNNNNFSLAFISYQTQFFEEEGIDREQTEDSIYFYTGHNRDIQKVFRLYVEDDELVVKEIYNENLGLECETYFVDKYNNFYIRPVYQQNYYTKVSYCISNGKLIRLDTKLRKDLNGIAYTEDGTMQVNENGELVLSTFVGEHIWLSSVDLVKKIGTIEYYYRDEVDSVENTLKGMNCIFKVTRQDEDNYTFEKIDIQNWESIKPKQYVLTKDYMYFRSEEKIFKTEITTGLTTELISEYYFTDIWTDNLGNVSFKALNSYMQNIYGIINNDGQIEIDIQDREFVIVYIKPLKIVD